MNHSVLDVLMYLFETFSDDEPESEADHDFMRSELIAAGFAETEVDRALNWLEDLNRDPGQAFQAGSTNRSIRLYNSMELARLDAACRGYIQYLENIGILQPLQRELIIDRLVALGPGEIDVDQVKWVVLMVLFSQPAGPENAFVSMEDLVFEVSTGLVN